MASRDRLIAEIAGAVADGELVDWEEVGRRAGDSDVSGEIANLRLIHELGRIGGVTSGVTSTRMRFRPTFFFFMVLVGIQITIALLAWALISPVTYGVPGWLLFATTLGFGGGGLVVALAGRWDPRTAPLAGFFLCIAAAAAQPMLTRAAAGAPPTQAMIWISAALFECFLPFFLWRFVQQFPRVVHLERVGAWATWAARLSLGLAVVLFAVNALHRISLGAAFSDGIGAMLLRAPTGVYWGLLFALALPAPLAVLTRARHAPVDERRRVRFFLFGLAAGILPVICAVLAEVLIPAWAEVMRVPRNRVIGSFVVYGCLLTLPVTLGYSAVVRRVLDFRFVVHRAAQAFLARGTLWAASVTPWLIIMSILWRNRRQPLDEIFSGPTVALLVATGLVGLVLIGTRDRALASIERRLLGRRIEPNVAVATLTRTLSTVRDSFELAQAIKNHGAALLHAESCFFFSRGSKEQGFVAVDGMCRSLDRASALADLAETTRDPISTDVRDKDSWMQWLPESDRLWLTDADVRLLVPVHSAEGCCVGLIAFGSSISGLVYGREDLLAANAVASSVALALAHLNVNTSGTSRASAEFSDEPAGECQKCRRIAPRVQGLCECGHSFRPAAIPFRVGGKFELRAILGAGGMGSVYLGKDLVLDRTVALKTLPRMRSDLLQRMRREARSMASFVHPNLALIFGIETWRGIPVLVVEYLARGTLADMLKEGLEPCFVVDLGIKIGGALSALHHKGMLHRDVKPANIGFSKEGEAKLLDFGLAQIAEETQIELLETVDSPQFFGKKDDWADLTGTDYIVGTPLYMSPEILVGGVSSPAQDLWSLHMVLWEALAGHHPLRGLSVEDAMDRLIHGHIPCVLDERPDLPKPLADLLAKGLSLAPESRPLSAIQLVGALEDIRGDVGI